MFCLDGTCRNGHLMTKTNINYSTKGYLRCKTCMAEHKLRKARLAGIKPRQTKAPIENFMAHVKKTDDCWIWLGAKNNEGYGMFDGRSQGKTTILAHRFSYLHHKGLIPYGKVLDHTCSMRACVNPDHLEVVSIGENTQRSYNRRKGII